MTSERPGLRLGVTIRYEDPGEVVSFDILLEATPFEEVTIASDFMSRAVFARDKPLFVRLAALLLEFDPRMGQLDASKIELVGNAELKSDPGARISRLDICCRTEDGPVIDVEMQRYRQQEFSRRLRTYLSSADRDAWMPGEEPADARDVIGVAVCTFDPVGLGQVRYMGKVNYVGTETYADDGRLVVLYNARAASWEQCEKEGIGHDLACFLRYVAGYHDDEVMRNEFVRDVDEQVRKCRMDEDLRRAYMDYQTKLRDSYEAGKAKGEANGRSEERRDILAAVAKAFADGEMTKTALALLGFTEEDCRSAMAATAQQA